MPGELCVLLADGFEEIEAITLVDVLRRAGLVVRTVGVTGTERVTGSHGIPVIPDLGLDEALGREWEMVVLPGGLPGAERLRDDPRVQRLLREQDRRGGRLAAICAAPIALGRAGVLRGLRATCYPGFQDQLLEARFSEERVVVDGRVATSRGPGTALEFALELVAQLAGAARADELARAMLVERRRA